MPVLLSLFRGLIDVPAPLPTMREIASLVAERHALSSGDLRGRSCCRHIARARQEAMALIYEQRRRSPPEKRRYSLPQIGAFFQRDHTTVLHGVRAHQARLQAAREAVAE